jgi:DNA-binding transcriptional LysR family regulator
VVAPVSPVVGSSGRDLVIDKLEFLIALAREQSFSRAAEICGVTQPTFSAGIKQLEDILGVPLVNRSSRFHGLTAEGERALEWAKRITADSRAMRQDVRSTRASLDGHLRIAAVPTVLGMVTDLTTPFRIKHPGVRFTVLSLSSRETLSMLDSFEIDAGLTYLDNEPVGHFKTIPLYVEQYRLLTSAHCPLGERASVTWSEVSFIPLCLLTSEMQNRRIIDRLLGNASAPPMLESNSMVVLFAHVRTGRWASVIPEKFAEILGLPEPLRSIPITAPREVHKIGLVVARREPMSPLVRALFAETMKLALPE